MRALFLTGSLTPPAESPSHKRGDSAIQLEPKRGVLPALQREETLRGQISLYHDVLLK